MLQGLRSQSGTQHYHCCRGTTPALPLLPLPWTKSVHHHYSAAYSRTIKRNPNKTNPSFFLYIYMCICLAFLIISLVPNFGKLLLMGNQESQEITAGGGSSEDTHVSPETTVDLTAGGGSSENTTHVSPETFVELTVEEAIAAREKFESLKRNVEGVTARLDNIHKFLLDIGNYFFAFQGVCLAAISNTSFFVCDNAWFLTFLCILAAVPSLASIAFVVHEWIGLMDQLDARLKEMNVIQNVVEEEQKRVFAVLKEHYSILTGHDFSPKLRYFLLLAGVIVILSFTAAVASWPHVMICRNGGQLFEKERT